MEPRTSDWSLESLTNLHQAFERIHVAPAHQQRGKVDIPSGGEFGGPILRPTVTDTAQNSAESVDEIKKYLFREGGERVVGTPTMTSVLYEDEDEDERNAGVEIEFNYLQFVLELVYLLGYPLSIPLCVVVEGYHGARNRLFLPSKNGSYIIQTISGVTQFGLAFLLAFHWTESELPRTEVLLPLLMCAWRSVIVAIKYSVAPVSIIDDLRKRPWSEKELFDQLLKSWLAPDGDRIWKEVNLATKRMGINHRHFFTYSGIGDDVAFNRQLHQLWTDLKTSAVTKREVGRLIRSGILHGKALSYLVTVESVLFRQLQGGRATAIAVVCCVPLALIHPLYRVADGDRLLGSSGNDAVLVLMASFQVLWSSWSQIVFMLIAIHDLRRRLYSVQRVTNLATGMMSQDLVEDVGDQYSSKSYLKLCCAQNVYCWVSLQVAISGLANNFRLRLGLYTSLYIVVVVLAVVWLAIELFVEDFNAASVIQVAYMKIVTLGFIGAQVAYGVKLNDYALVQISMLVKRQGEIRLLHDYTSEQGDKEVAQRLKHLDQMLTNAIKMTKTNAELNPVTVFGFRATHAITKAIGTVVVSSGPILLALVRESQNGGSVLDVLNS